MDAARSRAELIDDLDREGRLLAAAARSVDASATVPTCPGWSVRDLVLHQGEVHRWATLVVRDALAKPSAVPADHLGPLPDDAHLVDWFEDGHAGLVAALRAASDDLQAFRFLAEAGPAATFWARRQAHETEIHRIDAESAGGRRSPIGAASAADGIDELLTGFVPRPHTGLRSERPCTMAVILTDRPEAWHLAISNEPVITTRGESSAECTLRGTAQDVYLVAWNRLDATAVSITGDGAIMDRFAEHVRISW